MSDFETLVGAKVKGVYLYADNTLAFDTDKGILAYNAVGDCCSNSWFEHVSGINNIEGHTVIRIDDFDINEVIPDWSELKTMDLNTENEIKYYGFRIVTDKGYFEIDMRNSSNGYYGGYVAESSDKTLDGYQLLKDDF